jgi:transcriptional regulator with XRE-family HTH domain
MTTSQFIKENLNGVSAYRLSQLTGISTSLLSCYLNGKSEPSVDKLKLIIKALNIHRDNLNDFIYEN